MKKEGLTGGLGWGSGTGCAIPGAFTCGVSGCPNPTHMHVHLPGICYQNRNFVRGRRSGVYDLLSWINVYDMKMSRNLVWLIKKAEA